MNDQLELFAPSAPLLDFDEWFDGLPDGASGPDPDGARWFQREAVQSYFDSLAQYPWQLILLATGLGKTYVAGLIAKIYEGNILFLAHREELIWQAQRALQALTGELVEIEKAELAASESSRIVVGSVQSMNPKRLSRIGKDRFNLIITDECHHAPALSYGRIYEFFDAQHGLGLTATADRADEKALGKVFDHVAYIFDIRQGIEDGHLVPIKPCDVTITEVDLSEVQASPGTEGGLNLKELDEAMMRGVEGMVRETLRLAPTRHGIGFCPGKRSAEFAAMRMNALKPGSSEYISDDTDPDERRAIIERFRSGATQFLFNCMIATEGFDAPICDLIMHMRPTKSRALHTQMTGRGTRVLPGLVNHLREKDQAADRRAAIAASAKPDLMCLDFVGNWGSHSIVSTLDVLGGSYTEAEVKLAKKKQKSGEAFDGLAALEAARRELRALANRTNAKRVVSEVRWLEPFAMVGIQHDARSEEAMLRFGESAITDRQLEHLMRRGLTRDDAAKLSMRSASKLISELAWRQDNGLASYKQLRELESYGLPNDPKITFSRAQAGLNYCRQKQGRPNMQKLHEIVHYQEKRR